MIDPVRTSVVVPLPLARRRDGLCFEIGPGSRDAMASAEGWPLIVERFAAGASS